MENWKETPEKLLDTMWISPARPDMHYVVVSITNIAHRTPLHPPQVVYRGSNGNWWSLSLDAWPGNLVPIK